MDSWVKLPGITSLSLDSWLGLFRFGFLCSHSWIWNAGFGVPGLISWTWNPGFGNLAFGSLDLDSWVGIRGGVRVLALLV